MRGKWEGSVRYTLVPLEALGVPHAGDEAGGPVGAADVDDGVLLLREGGAWVERRGRISCAQNVGLLMRLVVMEQ